MPVLAMVIGWALAIAILIHYSAAPRRRGHELVWGLAFLMFGVASLAAVVGATMGWNEIMARVYYIGGAILGVAFLGIGELMLLSPQKWGRIAAWSGVVLSVLTLAALFTSPFDPTTLLTDTPWRAVAPKGSIPSSLAAISNIGGTVLIVGGTLYSAWVFWRKRIQKNRMIGCILLAVGTMVVASGGTFAARLEMPSMLYPPMALGMAIMFVGFRRTTRVEAPKKAIDTHSQPVDAQFIATTSPQSANGATPLVVTTTSNPHPVGTVQTASDADAPKINRERARQLPITETMTRETAPQATIPKPFREQGQPAVSSQSAGPKFFREPAQRQVNPDKLLRAPALQSDTPKIVREPTR